MCCKRRCAEGEGDNVEEPDPLTSRQLGIIAVHLALTFPVWVRRRKRSFTFVDDTTTRQRQSIDFSLPMPDAFPARAQPSPGQEIYVPLWIGDKSPLVKFSIMDEGGGALSLLNARESVAVVLDGVNTILRGLSARGSGTAVDPEQQRQALEAIFEAPKEKGRQTFDDALAPAGPLAGILRRDDLYGSFVADLATGFLMLVPLTYEPGKGRVLKMQHDAPHDWAGSKRRITRIAQRVLAPLSLADRHLGFNRVDIGWAESTHLEFESPEAVDLSVAQIDCDQWDAETKKRVWVPRRSVVSGKPAADLHVNPRVQIDPHDPDPARRDQMLTDLVACRQDTAQVRLRLRPSISGVITPAVVAAIATTAVLWMVLSRLGDLDGETSASLLLLFPAAAAALFARPGEHAFATRLLKGIRWAAAIVSTCALVAVGAISGGFIHDDVVWDGRSITNCEPRSGQATDRPARMGRSRWLRCVESRRHPEPPGVRDETRDAVELAAWVATAVTLVMALGMFSTQRNLRRRRREPDTISLAGSPI